MFQLSCQDIINNNTANQKISALCIAMLLLKRLCKTPCDQQVNETIDIVFQLIKCIDPVMCCYNIDIYDPLLINLASVILMSDYKIFEKVEKVVIQNILNTEYWSAMFSSDLWIIIMRYIFSNIFKLIMNIKNKNNLYAFFPDICLQTCVIYSFQN